MIRVLLADDHDVVLAGLSALLSAQADVEVVGQASDGDSAVQQAIDLDPDVAVLDLSMPRLTGIEAAKRIRDGAKRCKVIGLSMHDDRPYIIQFLRAGAAGYVSKRAAAEEVVKAVRIVAEGGMYLGSGASDMLLTGEGGSAGGTAERPLLSEREADVVRYLARGYTNKEISNILKVSIKSIETYKARAMEKLSARGRSDIVTFALQQGWLQTP